MILMKYAINWDLDSIFVGGSSSETLRQELNELSTKINSFHQLVEAFTPNTTQQVTELKEILVHFSFIVELLVIFLLLNINICL